jgi:hypothetical protein
MARTGTADLNRSLRRNEPAATLRYPQSALSTELTMALFSSKKQAPATPQAMTLNEYISKAEGDPNYGAFQAMFGRRHALLNLQALYDRNLRMMVPPGVWGPATAADYNRVAVGNSLLKINPGDMGTFDTFLSEQLRQDVAKTTARETYIGNLKNDALSGALRARLNANTELEANYYVAPAPRVQAVGAPPVPPKPPRAINTNKALAWAVGNPGVADDVKSVYRQAFTAHTTSNTAFPIRQMETLNAIWRKLVAGAPAYRSVNIMQPTKYPSSLAGTHIVKRVIGDFATVAQPAQGNAAWYDWALYFYAAIMTSQAFTDGNKRVSRLAYALILIDGGVDFVAPNTVLGAQLGDM